MTTNHLTVNTHYGLGQLFERIENGLKLKGVDLDNVSVDDLSAVDAFHTRGRSSTEELALLGNINEQTQLLDIGSGLGGSCRFLSNRYGCVATGLDLTDEYVEVADRLTLLVGMEEKVKFFQGNATTLPFDDNSFDVVWTEHAQMNIVDKTKFYAEVSRVLRPNGAFCFTIFLAVARNQPFRYRGQKTIQSATWQWSPKPRK